VFGDLIIINICQGVSLIEVKLAYRWILARRCSLLNRQVLGKLSGLRIVNIMYINAITRNRLSLNRIMFNSVFKPNLKLSL
jgi:hypothetical protein